MSSKFLFLSFGLQLMMNINIGFNSTSDAQHHCDFVSVNKRQWGTANNVSQPVEDTLAISLITSIMLNDPDAVLMYVHSSCQE